MRVCIHHPHAFLDASGQHALLEHFAALTTTPAHEATRAEIAETDVVEMRATNNLHVADDEMRGPCATTRARARQRTALTRCNLGIHPAVPEGGHGVVGDWRITAVIRAERAQDDLRGLDPALLEGDQRHALFQRNEHDDII